MSSKSHDYNFLILVLSPATICNFLHRNFNMKGPVPKPKLLLKIRIFLFLKRTSMYVNMFKGSSQQILSRCREECIFASGLFMQASVSAFPCRCNSYFCARFHTLKCFRQISFTKTRSSCSLGLPYCTFKQQVRFQLQKCGDSANKPHTTPLFISVTGCPS